MNQTICRFCLFILILSLSAIAKADVDATSSALPDWAIGPFARPEQAQPVISPDPHSVFDCPMRKRPIHWEATHTFNPASVVRKGKIYVLYRAEDDSGTGGIGSYTSRLGLATSEDGIQFTKEPTPVFYPADDNEKDWEWYGGCEDPRISEGPDGTYYLTYTQYSRGGRGALRLGLASSKDLRTWKKYGSPFTGTSYEDNHGIERKSASILNEVKDGHLVAAKVNGKYWMYFGEGNVNIASSDDLVHWMPVERAPGKPLVVMSPRHGFFDSQLDEVGPNAVLTDQGIVVFYNGKNSDPAEGGDSQLLTGVYTCGQALFDQTDPTKLMKRLDHPFFQPELAWEKSGQYTAGTTFIEGISLFHGKWFLYYGCADTFAGVAICSSVVTK